MSSIVYTIGMVVLWFINLFNNTGMGKLYQTTEIATMLALVIAIGLLASQALRDGDIAIKPKYFYTLVPLVLVFVGTSLFHGHRLAGLEGFWVYLLIYILSRARPSETAIRMTAIAYGGLGLFVLYVFNYTEVLKGWNSNTIAMIGLFSFLIFTIPFYGMREWRSFIAMPLLGGAYVFLIWPTDSRSCILFIIIQLLVTLRVVPMRKTFSSSKGLVLLLLIPLIVAAGTVLISTFGDMTKLTEWSYRTFDKPLFNSRDAIWKDAFTKLWETPLFGNGEVNAGYWHNSALSCLVGFGAVGFVVWVRLFYLFLKEGQPFLDDTCVIGCMAAFVVLYAQQSVELGIFAPYPSLLPYVILGILLGRVGYVREERQYA